MIADALTKENVAVLSFDKRGIAKSMGAVKTETDLRFDDYVNDVLQWI